jgi:hypothetical protein
MSRDPLQHPRRIAIRCRRQHVIDLCADFGHVIAQVYAIKQTPIKGPTLGEVGL